MINKRVDNKNIKILEDIFIYNIKGINWLNQEDSFLLLIVDKKMNRLFNNYF